MLDTQDNTAAPRQRSHLTIWINALTVVGFIAVMIFTAEGILAWVVGSFTHSTVLGFLVLAALGLPTLFWIVNRCIRLALNAEREFLPPPPA